MLASCQPGSLSALRGCPFAKEVNNVAISFLRTAGASSLHLKGSPDYVGSTQDNLE